MIQVGDIIKTFFKKYEVVEKLDDNTFLAVCKNKKFLVRTFEYVPEDGQELEYSLTRIKSSAIKAPKLELFDRKNKYAIIEYIEGESMAKYLSKHELNDDIYKQLFDTAYFAKMARITLNYEPDRWLLSEGKLYYVYPHILEYNEQKDLVKHYIRLWFNTKELSQFLNEKGLDFDKTRIKDEYTTNKEILLKTVSFYR